MTGSTRGEILALLKRNGGHTVSQLAAALKLAPITVRQHLTRLERDGLLVAEQQAGASGRPHYVFRLTAKAHAAAFPRRSDRLVELLIREIGFLDSGELAGLAPPERACLILQRLAERLADEYALLLEGWSLQERVVFVVEVMHADGGLAEWEKTPQGYEVRDFNCLFRRLLESEGEGLVCEWHRAFLSHMLGAEARVSPWPDAMGQCCHFVIEAAPQGEVAQPTRPAGETRKDA